MAQQKEAKGYSMKVTPRRQTLVSNTGDRPVLVTLNSQVGARGQNPVLAVLAQGVLTGPEV